MGKILWTEADEELCKKLLLEGVSYKEIANQLNRTIGAINAKKNKYFEINTNQIYKFNKNYK